MHVVASTDALIRHRPIIGA